MNHYTDLQLDVRDPMVPLRRRYIAVNKLVRAYRAGCPETADADIKTLTESWEDEIRDNSYHALEHVITRLMDIAVKPTTPARQKFQGVFVVQLHVQQIINRKAARRIPAWIPY